MTAIFEMIAVRDTLIHELDAGLFERRGVGRAVYHGSVQRMPGICPAGGAVY